MAAGAIVPSETEHLTFSQEEVSMTCHRKLLWCLSAAVLLAPWSATRAAEPAAVVNPADLCFGLLERMNVLLAPGAEDRLNLSAEQEEQLTKLKYEFRAKRRAALEAVCTELVRARQRVQDADDERQLDAGSMGIAIFCGFLKIRGLRDQYEVKAFDVLNADQKKQYAQYEREWRRQMAQQRAEHRDDRVHFRHVVEGQLLSPRTQQRLTLSAEQRAKLEALQRETDTKLQTILNDSQKERLEQIRHRATHGGRTVEFLPVQPLNRKPTQDVPATPQKPELELDDM
jgi:hypothetical protein